ncbi:MAG: DUF5719 family protein [Bifidobacterium sp.]|jgi:hypothetical protein|nr:DUF5719 family protein [Bifidobacterium sp.]
MSLPDSESYGDSEYQASQGNIASSARYAAFGAILQAQVSSLDGDAANEKDLVDSDREDQADVMVAAGNADHGAQLLNERLTHAQSGTGSAGAVASWATSGDLKGLSATACVQTGLSHSFLLPATRTGTTQQLIVANPSAKDTSLQIDVRGTGQRGALTLSTGRTLNVAAHKQATLDLSAAAPGQDGLFVTVASKETPVAAIVRMVSMDGLTPKGSDFAMPVGMSAANALDGLEAGDSITLFAYSRKAQQLKLQWLGPQGSADAGSWKLEGDKVTVIKPKDSPKDALSLVASCAGAPCAVQAMASDTAGGSADFAFLSAAPSVSSSTLVMPDKVQGQIILSNPDRLPHTATLLAYDRDGRQLESRKIDLRAHTALSLRANALGGDARLLVLSGAHRLHWGLRLSQDDVSGAGLAGIATLTPQPLEPQRAQVRAIRDPRIVH